MIERSSKPACKDARNRVLFSILVALVFTSASPFYVGAETFDPDLKIWENAPPDPEVVSGKKEGGIYIKENNPSIKWDLWGLVIGNGRLGATFYGNVADETVEFNEDSLWSGTDAFQVNRNLEIPKAIRPKMEAQISALEDELAVTPRNKRRALEKKLSPLTADGHNRTKGTYQPFGVIHIKMPHEQFTDYHRELDLSRSVGTVRLYKWWCGVPPGVFCQLSKSSAGRSFDS